MIMRCRLHGSVSLSDSPVMTSSVGEFPEMTSLDAVSPETKLTVEVGDVAPLTKHVIKLTTVTTLSQTTTSAASHSKTRSAPHCRVLPPGEFNGMNPELLSVYAESLRTTFLRRNVASATIDCA